MFSHKMTHRVPKPQQLEMYDFKSFSFSFFHPYSNCLIDHTPPARLTDHVTRHDVSKSRASRAHDELVAMTNIFIKHHR